MIRQAIILAGGLGTRLRTVMADLPKCMAPVAGHPFLHYVIKNLSQQGISDFIFSLGYKSEIIMAFLEKEFKDYPDLSYQCSIESTPLGTGGAIRKASENCVDEDILACNGDTLFRVDIPKLSAFHLTHQADCSLTLKPMKDFERYGVVECAADHRVISFREKQYYASGLINGGVYALNVASWLREPLPEKFSFEKDYLESKVSSRKMYGFVQDGYFIDIGIPEDYLRAQEEFLHFK
ncbi:MAG: nucleotidyltransferase family protein [Bacteroidota bacterium]|nr:nucleotidyltransferase family protein [Bacteroidota bacterium]